MKSKQTSLKFWLRSLPMLLQKTPSPMLDLITVAFVIWLTLFFVFALPSVRDDCCLGNHWSCDSNRSHRHHCTCVQDKKGKDSEKTRHCVSAHKVYPTLPSCIMNNLPYAVSLVEINHVIGPAGTLSCFLYALNWQCLEGI